MVRRRHRGGVCLLGGLVVAQLLPLLSMTAAVAVGASRSRAEFSPPTSVGGPEGWQVPKPLMPLLSPHHRKAASTAAEISPLSTDTLCDLAAPSTNGATTWLTVAAFSPDVWRRSCANDSESFGDVLPSFAVFRYHVGEDDGSAGSTLATFQADLTALVNEEKGTQGDDPYGSSVNPALGLLGVRRPTFGAAAPTSSPYQVIVAAAGQVASELGELVDGESHLPRALRDSTVASTDHGHSPPSAQVANATSTAASSMVWATVWDQWNQNAAMANGGDAANASLSTAMVTHPFTQELYFFSACAPLPIATTRREGGRRVALHNYSNIVLRLGPVRVATANNASGGGPAVAMATCHVVVVTDATTGAPATYVAVVGGVPLTNGTAGSMPSPTTTGRTQSDGGTIVVNVALYSLDRQVWMPTSSNAFSSVSWQQSVAIQRTDVGRGCEEYPRPPPPDLAAALWWLMKPGVSVLADPPVEAAPSPLGHTVTVLLSFGWLLDLSEGDSSHRRVVSSTLIAVGIQIAGETTGSPRGFFAARAVPFYSSSEKRPVASQPVPTSLLPCNESRAAQLYSLVTIMPSGTEGDVFVANLHDWFLVTLNLMWITAVAADPPATGDHTAAAFNLLATWGSSGHAVELTPPQVVLGNHSVGAADVTQALPIWSLLADADQVASVPLLILGPVYAGDPNKVCPVGLGGVPGGAFIMAAVIQRAEGDESKSQTAPLMLPTLRVRGGNQTAAYAIVSGVIVEITQIAGNHEATVSYHVLFFLKGLPNASSSASVVTTQFDVYLSATNDCQAFNRTITATTCEPSRGDWDVLLLGLVDELEGGSMAMKCTVHVSLSSDPIGLSSMAQDIVDHLGYVCVRPKPLSSSLPVGSAAAWLGTSLNGLQPFPAAPLPPLPRRAPTAWFYVVAVGTVILVFAVLVYAEHLELRFTPSTTPTQFANSFHDAVTRAPLVVVAALTGDGPENERLPLLAPGQVNLNGAVGTHVAGEPPQCWPLGRGSRASISSGILL